MSSGVEVVLVEPGGFRTGIWEELERDVEKRAGSRDGSAYRRAMSLTRLSSPVMGHPATVARVVAGAVASRSPRARYLVGYDAQAVALWDRFAPTVVTDLTTCVSLGP